MKTAVPEVLPSLVKPHPEFSQTLGLIGRCI